MKSGFDPLKADPGELFSVIANTKFSLSGLDPGTYRVELWDTWGRGKLRTQELETSPAGELELRLPPMTRDLAVKMFRLSDITNNKIRCFRNGPGFVVAG